MKLIVLLSLLFLVTDASSQTIQISPIKRVTYCERDTLTLSYTTTGSFAADNIFIAQLSGVNDSFKTFTNVGTDNAHLGYFKIKLNQADSQYLFRVVATNPSTTSNYAGSNISVASYPSTYMSARGYPNPGFQITTSVVGLIGDSIRLSDASSSMPGSVHHWRFGQDASISHSDSSVAFVTYPTIGIKRDTVTVINSSGCSSIGIDSFRILSCTPRIPKDVHIVTGSESGTFRSVWVKPGGNFNAGPVKDSQSIFVESGGSIVLSGYGGGFIYLKNGASFTDTHGSESFAAVVLQKGLVVNLAADHIDTFYCNNLIFDTSNFHSGVRSEASNVQFKQRGDFVEVSGLEGETSSIIIYDILGSEIAHANNIHVPKATFNTRPFESGAYFLRVETSVGLKSWRFQIVR